MQDSWHLCSRRRWFQWFIRKCCIAKGVNTVLTQRIECMLHTLLQHLVCREVRLTATTSRSKSLDEAVRILDLALGILNTSVRAYEWWGCFQSWLWFPIIMIFCQKKKWFYPNIYIYKDQQESINQLQQHCSKQIKFSKPPCLSLSHMVTPCKTKESVWRQQNILLLTVSECIIFHRKSSHTLEFLKRLRFILKNPTNTNKWQQQQNNTYFTETFK